VVTFYFYQIYKTKFFLKNFSEMTAIFRKRKIEFELKIDENRKLFVHCNLRNIKILSNVF